MIFKRVIARDLNPEGCQALKAGESECPLCLHFDEVYLMLESARPDRLQGEPISDLREGAVPFQARVEDLEFATAWAPAPVRGRAAECIPALSAHPPDIPGEMFGIDRLKRVEDAAIMNGPPADHVQVYVL